MVNDRGRGWLRILFFSIVVMFFVVVLPLLFVFRFGGVEDTALFELNKLYWALGGIPFIVLLVLGFVDVFNGGKGLLGVANSFVHNPETNGVLGLGGLSYIVISSQQVSYVSVPVVVGQISDTARLGSAVEPPALVETLIFV